MRDGGAPAAADAAPPPPARIYYTDHFPLPLPPGHRFPIEKYAALRRRIVQSGLCADDVLAVPPPAPDAALRRVHDAAYVAAVADGTLDRAAVRRIGFPWSPALVERSRRSVGATIAACRAARRCGAGVSLAGGTHHASADRGEGYCVFNDVAVAARDAQAEGWARRVLVVDCDVHQGNGTAAIFAGDDTVFTLDLYGARNFPFDKAVCDLDVPLADGTEDAEYLGALASALAEAAARSTPDLVVYLAGADPWAGDRLGRLAVSKAGLAERDRHVLAFCRKVGVPVVVVMAGGYAPDVRDTVDIHFRTVATALDLA